MPHATDRGTPPTPGETRLLLGIWRVADPKITLASAASMFLGAAVAGGLGPIAWGWLGATLAGIFFLEAAKNASGEIFDWDSGADTGLTEAERTPFSGGKRVLVDRLMTRRQCAVMAAVFYALGLVAGLAIVRWREPRVLWFGLAGLALAYFYQAPPFRLAYRGLGEAAVALAYGPLIACGTCLVQRHAVPAAAILLSAPLGLAILAFLWINEMPDARADLAAGKRTLVARLGRRRAVALFGLLILLPYAVLILLVPAGRPAGVLGGFLGFPWAARVAARRRALLDEPVRWVPSQAATLLSFVLLALGAGAGFLFGGS